LKDPDSEVRVSAASALGSTKNLSAVEPLIAALAETDDEIREAAPTVGDADVVVDASSDPNSGARREAAEALGEIGDLRAVEPLIAALKDTNVSVREGAAEALGVLKDPRAIGPLIDVLRNPDDLSRRQAAASLVNFKDPRVVDALIASLGDDWVHGSAAQALDEIKVDPGVAWPLIVALNDPNPKIRGTVADLLGRIKDPRASKPLTDALFKDPDEDVRLSVVKALIRRGEPGSEKVLIAALDYRPNIDIANELLNCGNPILHDAVRMRYETTFAGPHGGSSGWGATR
jgi:HEAT repeat protein